MRDEEKEAVKNESENTNEENLIYQIYDKMFKKVITLSNGAVINLINSLFDTKYPRESTVSYNWTESVDGKLERRLADAIVTVTEPESSGNSDTTDSDGDNLKGEKHMYHMEAQIERDDDIIFRMFDYGYRNAVNNVHGSSSDGNYVLRFPEPKIIYIYSSSPVPDEYELTLDFGTQGSFKYKVQSVKLHKMSIQELNDRKMIILIPFKLLELREVLKKDRSRTNIEALHSLVFDGIIGSIRKNVELGNITRADGRMLINMTKYLYDYLYAHYQETREVTELTDESILLEVEKVERECQENLELEVERVERECQEKLVLEVGKVERECQEKLREKDRTLEEKDREIQRLKALLKELKA